MDPPEHQITALQGVRRPGANAGNPRTKCFTFGESEFFVVTLFSWKPMGACSLIFVHGTGVRKPAYEKALQRITQKVASVRPDVGVVDCLWGDALGARLNAGGASIPEYDVTKALGGPTAAEELIVLWQMLFDDPLFEVRALANGAAESGIQGFGRLSPGEELRSSVQRLELTPNLRAALDGNELTRYFYPAVRQLTDEVAFRDAAAIVSDVGTARIAAARALVAVCLALRTAEIAETAPAVDVVARNEAVVQILDQLGGSTKSISGWITRQLAGLALKAGALNFAVRKRGALTDASFPASGDILVYQSAAGAAIRDFIRSRIEAIPGRVVVLAHSLGGIACVDLLILRPLPQVALLITVGSQAPYFYELNALHSLRYPEPLPRQFPPWLNFYDRRDLLSFIGNGVFPERVEDVLVDNGLSFPYSHSGYWANDAVWSAIVSRLPQ
jgi:hypothetical protein